MPSLNFQFRGSLGHRIGAKCLRQTHIKLARVSVEIGSLIDIKLQRQYFLLLRANPGFQRVVEFFKFPL